MLTGLKPFDQPILSIRIQLGKHVIQHERWLCTIGLGQGAELEELERDHRTPLLAGRAVLPERPPADLESEIVAVRPYGGNPPPGIREPRLLDGIGPSIGRI
jgi:hypothetical protein